MSVKCPKMKSDAVFFLGKKTAFSWAPTLIFGCLLYVAALEVIVCKKLKTKKNICLLNTEYKTCKGSELYQIGLK